MSTPNEVTRANLHTTHLAVSHLIGLRVAGKSAQGKMVRSSRSGADCFFLGLVLPIGGREPEEKDLLAGKHWVLAIKDYSTRKYKPVLFSQLVFKSVQMFGCFVLGWQTRWQRWAWCFAIRTCSTTTCTSSPCIGEISNGCMLVSSSYLWLDWWTVKSCSLSSKAFSCHWVKY